jgi:hypothetical protein
MRGSLLIPLCDWVDTLLTRHGSFRSIQHFRLYTSSLYITKERLKTDELEELFMEIMRLEHLLRQWVQLKEKYQLLREGARLKEHMTDQNQSLAVRAGIQQAEGYIHDRLEVLEVPPRAYWYIERELYMKEALLPKGAFLRAYNLWRSNPKWYLHPELVNDCAGNGGCCGSDCGCCEKRVQATERRRAAGHCTMECDCCARRRGFHCVTFEEKEKAIALYTTTLEDKTHRRRMQRAYFFGIDSGTADPAPRWI